MLFNIASELEENSSETGFNAVVEQISNGLFQINSNINNIQKLQASLATRFNGASTSNNITNIQQRILELISSTNDAFKRLNDPKNALVSKYTSQNTHGGYTDNVAGGYTDNDNNINDGENTVKLTKNQTLQKEKILREISSSLLLFQNTQQEFKQFIEKKELNQLLISEEEEQQQGVGSASGKQQQQQQQQLQLIKELDPINNEELVYHTQLINQREEEIQNIESSISELNVIFKDLDTLVNDQGFMIDNIENNLNNFSDSVKYADAELVRANRNQRRSMKTKKCLILICAVVIFLLMIVVLALT